LPWLGRDLRRADHSAPPIACEAGPDGVVVPVFVVDHAHERRVSLDRYERVRATRA
jgi:hypothetical protein